MNIQEFVVGAFVGIIGDYVGFNMVDALSKATPGWSSYGWGLYIAFNAAIVLWLKRALSK